MAQESPAYQRLGGRARTFAGSHALYLGADHLLYVVNNGFSETYKRFFFTDIQALVLSQSSRRRNLYLALTITTVTVAIGTVIGLLIASAQSPEVSRSVGSIFFGGLGLLFVSLFGWNAYLGPTCLCSISTAVQTERLVPLCRIREALRIFEQIQTRVTAVQGSNPIPTWADASIPPVRPVTAGAGKGPALRPWLQQTVRHENGRWHIFLFCMLLLEAVLSAVDMAVTSLAVTLIASIQTMVVVVAVVAALIRQRDSDLPKRVRTMVWSTLGYILFMFAVAYCYFIVVSIENPGIQPDQWQWLKLMAATDPWESPFAAMIFIVGIISGALLGCLGLFFLLQHWRAMQPQAPAPPAPPPAPPPPPQ